jgi:hypothetical protein
MTLTLDAAKAQFDTSPTLARRLDLNAVEATCECGTFLAWLPLMDKLVHVDGCVECYDPRTTEQEPCDNAHTCMVVTPKPCLHSRCGNDAKVFTGACQDDLEDCCGCCQAPDYDIND